jgi:mono/diheme cytochrome c family protein
MKMSKIGLALLACPVALLAAPSAQTGDSNSILEGQRIFQEQCSVCHGADASGAMGPSLRGKLKHGSTRAAIQSVIRNGVPGTAMPATKTMPAATLNHLTDYILSLQKPSK